MKKWLASLPKSRKILFISLLCLSVLFFLYLCYQACEYWATMGRVQDLKDQFMVKNDFIKTLAQILGGAFFLFTLYFTWANLATTQEKNITDLFTKAIDQLGDKDKLEVRLGGIYALERIARESAKHHWTIMEVMTAYVRENAPWPPEEMEAARKKRPWSKPRGIEPFPPTGEAGEGKDVAFKPDADIQAVLTVIGRRIQTYGNGETQPLDLGNTDMRGADLRSANLQKAILTGANLSKAKLGKANLQEAKLTEADLQKTELGKAQLQKARLGKAKMQKAKLRKANLQGAYLFAADLQGADLEGAVLQRVDLRGTKGLTRKQLGRAITDESPKFPEYLPPVPGG